MTAVSERRAAEKAAVVALGTERVPLGLAKPWQWVQPANDADLIARLIEAREYAVHERERENLCSVAAAQLALAEERIGRLEAALPCLQAAYLRLLTLGDYDGRATMAGQAELVALLHCICEITDEDHETTQNAYEAEAYARRSALTGGAG